jgi:hypothetical protein
MKNLRCQRAFVRYRIPSQDAITVSIRRIAFGRFYLRKSAYLQVEFLVSVTLLGRNAADTFIVIPFAAFQLAFSHNAWPGQTLDSLLPGAVLASMRFEDVYVPECSCARKHALCCLHLICGTRHAMTFSTGIQLEEV